MLVMVHCEFASVLAICILGVVPTNTICYMNCIVSVQWLIAAVKVRGNHL